MPSPTLRQYAMLCLIAAVAIFAPRHARAGDDTALAPLIDRLASDSFADKAEAVEALGRTGNPRARVVLRALADGNLCRRAAAKNVVICRAIEPQKVGLTDAVTGNDLGTAPAADAISIGLNNRVRRALEQALGSLTLADPDPALRTKAADELLKNPAASALPGVLSALKAETDDGVRIALSRAAAAIRIISPETSPSDLRTSIGVLARDGSKNVIAALERATSVSDQQTAEYARKTLSQVQSRLALWAHVQDAWYGLSLGSVLFLAAIGLAITFGVMGVINMAHGEMVMIGAYVTYIVQEWMRQHQPGWLEGSLLVALPLAFLVTGAIGIVIERGVIRFLYGRPLETLLATFGVSLVLQQAVRSLFGPTNREVSSPKWMSGSFDFGSLSITYGRLWIVLFAIAVFFGLLALLRATPFGLQMRAVTQNRRMAASMGIRTKLVDALAFGLGSGIAGISGVALSQIDNVSPNLGQSYIIDSFMVVVFGGVGNLFGTLVAALTLGVASKFAEPIMGAVLAKIAILVFIILFIQKRPKGLFAQKGRSVEA